MGSSHVFAHQIKESWKPMWHHGSSHNNTWTISCLKDMRDGKLQALPQPVVKAMEHLRQGEVNYNNPQGLWIWCKSLHWKTYTPNISSHRVFFKQLFGPQGLSLLEGSINKSKPIKNSNSTASNWLLVGLTSHFLVGSLYHTFLPILTCARLRGSSTTIHGGKVQFCGKDSFTTWHAVINLPSKNMSKWQTTNVLNSPTGSCFGNCSWHCSIICFNPQSTIHQQL